MRSMQITDVLANPTSDKLSGRIRKALNGTQDFIPGYSQRATPP